MSQASARPRAKIFHQGETVPVDEFLADLRDRYATIALISRHPALSDREVIERLLPLANGAAIRKEKVEVFARFGLGLYLTDLGSSLPHDELATYALVWWDEIRRVRSWFREQLGIVLSGSDEDKTRLMHSAVMLQEDVVPVPLRELGGQTFSITNRLYPLTIDAACAYALLLLLDAQRMRDIRGKLARCRLEKCGAYFLSVATRRGGPRPKYCEPGHQGLASKLTAAERTALWRATQAAKHK